MDSIFRHKKEILELLNKETNEFKDFNDFLKNELDTNGGLLHPQDVVEWYKILAKMILDVVYKNKETLNISQVDLIQLDEYIEQLISRISKVDGISFLYSLQQTTDTCSRSRRQQLLQDLFDDSDITNKYSLYSSGVCGSFGSFKIK